MIEWVAPVASTASFTVSNTGCPLSIVVPPLPGVTPPTTFVPYASIRCVWNAPSRPVIPCTITLEFLSRKIATVLLLSVRARELDGALRALVHRLDRDEPGLGQDRAALFRVGAGQPHDQRHLAHVAALERFDDPLRDLVAAGDPAEDVDEHRAHLGIAGHEVVRLLHEV